MLLFESQISCKRPHYTLTTEPTGVAPETKNPLTSTDAWAQSYRELNLANLSVNTPPSTVSGINSSCGQKFLTGASDFPCFFSAISVFSPFPCDPEGAQLADM